MPKSRPPKKRPYQRLKEYVHRLLQPKVETLMADRLLVLEQQLRQEIQQQLNQQLEHRLHQEIDLVSIGLRQQLAMPPHTVPDWQKKVTPGASYLNFEDVFRDPAVITKRHERYIPLLTNKAPILDSGCGRGEFLKLLEQQHIAAFGIDASSEMISYCQQQGLSNVAKASALDYLRSAVDHSIGGIFSSHVIEHWPVDQLAEFFILCRQKLKPGGIAIIETVNPHCLPAFKLFWLDPTHVRPLFPEYLEWCALSAGLTKVEIKYLTETGFTTTNPSQYGNYAIIAHTLPHNSGY